MIIETENGKRELHNLTINGHIECPVCGNLSLCEGEYVDVGVGMQKVSPDGCYTCHYVESNMYRPALEGFDNPYAIYEYQKKCWELQLDPVGVENCYA